MRKNSSWVSFKRIMSFARPGGFWVAIRILGAAAGSAIDIYLAYIVVSAVGLSLAGRRTELVNTIYTLAAVIAAGVFFSFLNRYSSGRISTYCGRDIRRELARCMEKLPVSCVENQHTGELVSRLTSDIALVQGFLHEDLPNLIFQPLRFIGTFAFLFAVNWKLLLFSVVAIPAAMILAGIISNPMSRYAEELQKYLSRMNSMVQDVIGGIFIVKSFNLQDVLFKKYASVVNKALDKSLAAEKRISLMTPVDVLTQIMPFVLCIAYGGYLSVKGDMAPEGLLAFIQLLNYLVEPAGVMPGLISNTRSTLGAANHMFEILDMEAEREGGLDFGTDPHVPPVEFVNAAFSYNGQSDIISGLNLEIGTGRKLALVGSSGSGKSTLLKLICGFYSLTDGHLKLFGHELDEWDLRSARNKISVVTQDTFLFPTTIAENIAYGRPGAPVEEVIRAAKAANAHDFIMQLPKGYNTLAGERGARLSGGQKQRIAIARAILKDAPVLLLDEATSALDTHSEALVREALERFMEGRTVLIVAHRLSTIRNADEILVLDQGRIAERGTHEQLMEKSGLYKQLYLKQLDSNERFAEGSGKEAEECLA